MMYAGCASSQYICVRQFIPLPMRRAATPRGKAAPLLVRGPCGRTAGGKQQFLRRFNMTYNDISIKLNTSDSLSRYCQLAMPARTNCDQPTNARDAVSVRQKLRVAVLFSGRAGASRFSCPSESVVELECRRRSRGDIHNLVLCSHGRACGANGRSEASAVDALGIYLGPTICLNRSQREKGGVRTYSWIQNVCSPLCGHK